MASILRCSIFLPIAQSKIPNLTGIKYTHEDFMDILSCLEFSDGQYDILQGRDETLLSALPLGCQGAVGSTYNVVAPLYIQIMKAFELGDMKEARRLQSISIKIIRVLAGTSCFYSALKESMKMLGLEMGGVREPLHSLSEQEIITLKKDLTQAGFFEFCSK